MTLYYPPTANGISKQLDAQLDVGTTASVTLNNVTNIQNKAGVFVVDRVDSTGALLDSSGREYVAYTAVSGNTLTGLTRGVGGSTDQDHAIGAIVEFIPDVVWADGIMDALDNAFDSAGALDTTKVVDLTTAQTLTNKTLTSAVLNTGVSGTAVLDEDNMASDSATKLATQQSIKAYVDANGASTQTRSIWLPASGMGATLGSPSLTDTDDTGAYWALDATADEGVGTVFLIPSDFSSGNITLYIYWASLTTNTGNIRWNIRRSIPAEEDELVLTANTNTSFTEAAIATANDLNISAGQAISGAAAGDAMALSVRRLGSDGADTLAGDVAFLGLRVDYTSTQ